MFFCFLETKWPLVFLCCFLFAKNWILLQLPTRTFYENVNYDSICKKKKKGILKCKANPFFPHQCFDLRDVIFLFDFSKFIFVLIIPRRWNASLQLRVFEADGRLNKSWATGRSHFTVFSQACWTGFHTLSKQIASPSLTWALGARPNQPLQAPRVAGLSIAMKTCSSSNMAACRSSAAFMVHCPVSQSNLHPVFEPPPPPPVLPQSEHMDSHPQLQTWQMILFVCFICGSKQLGPQFRCTPSIYHVNTLFISLFIYLFIYFVYLLDTCGFVNYHVFIYCF